MASDLRLVGGGIKSLIPSLGAAGGTGGTVDPRYCYSVWLRHLRMIAGSGIDPVRRSVVELGPGDSIGTGLAALLTTAECYTGLDVVPHAADVVQTKLFDAVAEMVRSRAAIPDSSVFPELFPRLESYDFPADLVSASRLQSTLADERIESLRQAIRSMTSRDAALVRYVCPWSSQSVARASADLVFSQAVLQEIDNRGSDGGLRRAFGAMATWLKPGGVMSHQIDLGMYGADQWDRHWTYSDPMWAVIRGHRMNYVNREPLSTYERLCTELGFDVVRIEVVRVQVLTPTHRLAPRFRTLSERDRTARSVHLVAVKR